jgi:hypothetical protein
MIDKSGSAEIDDFQHVLDVYGADAERWPAEARARLGPLPARNEAARVRLAEARALERLFAFAPLPSPERVEALRERIVMAARAQRQQRASYGRMALADAPRRMLAWARRDPFLAAVVEPQARWKVAAVLAASLVAGILLGQVQPVGPAIRTMAETTVFPAAGDRHLVAMFDDTALWPGLLDEEDEL